MINTIKKLNLKRRTRLFLNRVYNILVYRYVFKNNRRASFLIIGAQKAGTTSLYYFLNKHPQCIGGSIKQVNFFDNDINYHKGINWYHQQFKLCNKKLLKNNAVHFFEASPEYLLEEICAEKIFKYNPDMKILAILREPVKRAFSAYNMWMQFRESKAKHIWNKTHKFMNDEGQKNLKKILFGEEILPFRYWVERELELLQKGVDYGFPYFVKRGLYAEQLDVYFKQFPKEQIMVIEDVQLKNDKTQTMDAVASFLTIEHIDWDLDELKDMHIRAYKTKLDDNTKQLLQRFYAPHNQKLLAMNIKMSWINE